MSATMSLGKAGHADPPRGARRPCAPRGALADHRVLDELQGGGRKWQRRHGVQSFTHRSGGRWRALVRTDHFGTSLGTIPSFRCFDRSDSAPAYIAGATTAQHLHDGDAVDVASLDAAQLQAVIDYADGARTARWPSATAQQSDPGRDRPGSDSSCLTRFRLLRQFRPKARSTVCTTLLPAVSRAVVRRPAYRALDGASGSPASRLLGTSSACASWRRRRTRPPV